MGKPTQRTRIIEKLNRDGEITNVWAAQNFILRLSERMRELEQLGWKFDADYVRIDGKKTGSYRYSVQDKPKKTVWDAVERDGRIVRVPRLV